MLKASIIFAVIYLISTVKCIWNASDALPNQFPYQAFIDVYRAQTNTTTSCSGAVIHPQFVITSFVCVTLGDKFRVILGSLTPHQANDTPAYDHETKVKPFTPEHTSAHEGYIALLKLEIPIDDVKIQPVALPSQKSGTERKADVCDVSDYKFSAIATGYIESDPSEKKRLQFIDMKIFPISHCYCVKDFSENMLRTPLCVRGVNEYNDPVRGSLCAEKGVPLVRHIDGALIGIFDYTDSCESGAANLFIKVERFVDWIHKTIQVNKS